MSNSESLEYLNQSRILIEKEQYSDAIEYIDKAITADRMNKELYVQKSIILANLDKYDEGIEELNNALKLDKSYAEAYFHLGNLFLMTGERALGIENYNKAIAYGFDDSQIYYNLGLLYEEDDEDDLALRNYSKAIMKDPLRPDARVRKARIFINHNKYQEAIEVLDELILADPDLYEGYHLKTIVLAEMGQLDEAMSVIDDAVKLFPKDPAFLIDRINILVMRGEKEKAWETLLDIENNYEVNTEQKRHLELEKSRLYALESDVDKIIACLINAREYTKEMDPDAVDPEATFMLSSCYLEKKDYHKAIDCSKELIESEELSYAVPSYYTLPLAYSLLGEKEKAELLYKESISKLRAISLKYPGVLDTYFFRALCHRDLKQYDKALELCDYLLKLDDQSEAFQNLKAEVLRTMNEDSTVK